jgi:hypothetical protein
LSDAPGDLRDVVGWDIGLREWDVNTKAEFERKDYE